MADDDVQHLVDYKKELEHLKNRTKVMTKLIKDLEDKGVSEETEIHTTQHDFPNYGKYKTNRHIPTDKEVMNID